MNSYLDKEGRKYGASIYGEEGSYAAIQITENPFSICLIGYPVRDTIEQAAADLEQYAAKNEMEAKILASVSFPAKDTETETCPICSHYPVEFNNCNFEGSYYISPWNCPNCGSYGRQMEEVVFDGHVVDVEGVAVPKAMIPASAQPPSFDLLDIIDDYCMHHCQDGNDEVCEGCHVRKIVDRYGPDKSPDA